MTLLHADISIMDIVANTAVRTISQEIEWHEIVSGHPAHQSANEGFILRRTIARSLIVECAPVHPLVRSGVVLQGSRVDDSKSLEQAFGKRKRLSWTLAMRRRVLVSGLSPEAYPPE